MNDLVKTADRLCALSRRAFSNPFADFQWPERLDGDQWSTSPELISIYGSQAYEAMSEPERKRLSFYEAVNFFSLNIHGEKALVEGLAARLEGTAWAVPPLFQLIQQRAEIGAEEMLRVFNMGIGMVVAVAPGDVASVRADVPEAIVVGEVAPARDGPRVVVS